MNLNHVRSTSPIPIDYRPPCADDPDLWFSDGADNQATAKRICVEECRAFDACARWAADDDAPRPMSARHGIAAAKTPQERATPVIDSGRKNAALHGTPNGYKAHYRRGEPACDACRLAWTEDCANHDNGRAHAKSDVATATQRGVKGKRVAS